MPMATRKEKPRMRLRDSLMAKPKGWQTATYWR